MPRNPVRALAWGAAAGAAAAWAALALLVGLAALRAGAHAPAAWWPWVLWARARSLDPGAGRLSLWCGAGAGLWAGWAALRADPQRAVYGAAAWGRLASRPTLWVGPWHPAAPPPPGGLVVGAPAAGRVALVPAAAEHHGLILGATGAGKTSRHILPTLVALGLARTPFVALDLKGDLAPQLQAWLAARGYAVRVLDFADPTPATSAQWNPLVPVTAALAAGDLARASRAAWDLGHVLAADPGGPRTEPFWQQAQEALLAALALGVGDVAPPEAAHPASLFRTLTQYQDVLDGWFASFPDAHPARQAYGPVQQSADVTRMGILTTTTARLRLVADPQMAWLTSGHDPVWPMGVPPGPDTPWAAQPVAVFVRLPREETRLPLLALFLTQLLDALMALAEALPGRTLPAPTWFILDEFGNLPALPHFARHLTLLRSYGVRFVLAVQNLQQIAARYPDEHQIITDNCLTWVYLSTNSLETARQVSELAGQRTVLIRTTTTQAGGQGQSLAPTGRPLVTPDELLRWPRGVALVLQQGAPPLRVPTRPLAETPWRGALHPAVAPAPDPVPPVPVWPPPDPPAADAWDAEPLPVDADSLPF